MVQQSGAAICPVQCALLTCPRAGFRLPVAGLYFTNIEALTTGFCAALKALPMCQWASHSPGLQCWQSVSWITRATTSCHLRRTCSSARQPFNWGRKCRPAFTVATVEHEVLLVAGGVYPGFWRGPWPGLPGCAPEQIIVAAKSLFTCCASPLRIHQQGGQLARGDSDPPVDAPHRTAEHLLFSQACEPVTRQLPFFLAPNTHAVRVATHVSQQTCVLLP